METLTHIRGKEAETFLLIAPFVKNEKDRAAAVEILARGLPDQSKFTDTRPDANTNQ